MPRPINKRTPDRKAGVTAPSSRGKAGSAERSAKKVKMYGAVKSSQSDRMKKITSESEGDKRGSPVKAPSPVESASSSIKPLSSSVESSSSIDSSSSRELSASSVGSSTSSIDSPSSTVYPNIETTRAVSTNKDSSIKHAKSRDASPVESQCEVALIDFVQNKEIALSTVSPPESPLPSLPDGNSNPNESSAQKKFRKDRWNRMLEAELPFLIAEARTELAMHNILQGAREMEELFIKAMEEEGGQTLIIGEEKQAQLDASMQKLREANDRFDKQFRMDQEPDLVDIQHFC
ncbi:hypothetical protein EG327_002630 [Venturia inaequalis]|nr:hypothetical protein EG327_002630 [Venturia inaequalis]